MKTLTNIPALTLMVLLVMIGCEEMSVTPEGDTDATAPTGPVVPSGPAGVTMPGDVIAVGATAISNHPPATSVGDEPVLLSADGCA